MKKLTALFLALVMLLSLAACGGNTNSNDGLRENGTTENPDHSTTSQKEPTKGDEIIFSEMIAVENEECTITITGIDPDNMWGYTVEVLLENKSVDKTYIFSVENAAINGVQSDPFFASEVAAGKKANEKISFSDEELEENGITKYTDIELSFCVYNSNDWLAENVAEETVHIYPFGEENAETFVRESQGSDNVIIDNNYITAVVTGYEKDDIWGYSVKLFLINKTDKNIMFSVEEAAVNGFMADPFYATSVSAGKCAFSSISWSDTTFAENNITKVDEIEFILKAYDEDDWFSDSFANEKITLKP